ncbi:MAG: DUF1579 family protein [Phycisphaerales bacterium]|nr:DUF1579 family protein [Phycisphaerales bacterium]
MNVRNVLVFACGVSAVFGAAALAQQSGREAQGAPEQPAMQLPAGWTEADMEACMLAGIPGEMHAELMKSVGVWHGKGSMWMGAGMDPMSVECTNTITSTMDGRYIVLDMQSEVPGMGAFTGHGIYGFDNTTQKLVGSWIDNYSTGIMQGEGTLSADRKVITMSFRYTCPITKKPATMREVETITGPNSRTLEMFATDPKSGKEYMMLRYELTRKS